MSTSEDYIDAGGLGGGSSTSTEDYIDAGGLGGGSGSSNTNWLADIFKGITGGGSGGTSGGTSGGAQNLISSNAGAITALLGLYALMGGNKPKMAGYAGSIPRLTATRQQYAQPAGRRPGSEAGRYMSDVTYAAQGGYLRGATGGMSDELDTTIDGKQPAKLSHGEFVIPADVVSHLGDGNSEAGAKKLYEMMDRVRRARTGSAKQAPEINADKLMPKHAEGGEVGYATGGTVGTAEVGTLAPWAGEYITGMLGKGQALAEMPYTPYTGALTPGASQLQQQGFAGLGALQTPAGIGAAEQRTAQLGQQMGGLSYAPGTFTSDTFTPAAAQQYMNPYLQASLNPQLDEARRQAEIQRVQQAGRLTKAGAYGGSRQAIMESELGRNLQQNLANITGQGYNTAYQQAQQAFQSDQQRRAQAEQAREQSRQFGAGFGLQGLQAASQAAQQQAALAQAGQQAGLQNLQAQLGAGATQRDIEAQGLAADYNRFKEERAWPYEQLKFQQSLLQQLPVSAVSTQAETSPLMDIGSALKGLLGIKETLGTLGQS
jgi:hypothetical protein